MATKEKNGQRYKFIGVVALEKDKVMAIMVDTHFAPNLEDYLRTNFSFAVRKSDDDYQPGAFDNHKFKGLGLMSLRALNEGLADPSNKSDFAVFQKAVKAVEAKTRELDSVISLDALNIGARKVDSRRFPQAQASLG